MIERCNSLLCFVITETDIHLIWYFLFYKGAEFQYENLGKAIPPPKDRLPSGGNYKEMPEGVMQQQEMGQEENQYQEHA